LAVYYGLEDIVRLILADKRANPAAEDNALIRSIDFRQQSKPGHPLKDSMTL
jgi:hypothetical protein